MDLVALLGGGIGVAIVGFLGGRYESSEKRQERHDKRDEDGLKLFVQHLQGEVAAQRLDAQRLSAEVSTLREKLEAKDQQYDQLLAAYGKLQAEAASLEEKNSLLALRCSSLEREVAELKAAGHRRQEVVHGQDPQGSHEGGPAGRQEGAADGSR